MVTGLMGMMMLALPFVFVGLILWLSQNRRRDRHASQAEVQKEIISKFTSGAELQAFLKSDEGRALFRDFGAPGVRPPRHPRTAAMDRILTGIILIVIGAGLAVLSHYSDQTQILTSQLPQRPPPGTVQAIPEFPVPPPGTVLELPPGMGLPAAVLFLAGIGLALSGAVSLYLKTWETDKS